MDSGAADNDDLRARLAEQLAAFLKTRFVYQSNNLRVREALQACLETTRRLQEAGPARIVVRAQQLRVNDLDLEPPLKPLVEWLREAFRRTGLAGVEFERGVREDAMIEFAERMRANFTEAVRNPASTGLWAERIAAIRLLEPRFQGRFGSRGGHGSTAMAYGSYERNAALIEKLRRLPAVAQELGRLERIVRSGREDGGGGEAIDLVPQILDCMPSDLLQDADRTAKIVEAVLAYMANELADSASRLAGLSAVDFRKEVLRVGLEFFGRPLDEASADEEEEEEQEAGPRGHAGDERFDDSMQEFLEELAKLPAPPDGGFAIDESHHEQLGVCMHHLSRPTQEAPVENLTAHLLDLLEDPDPERIELVRSYLETEVGREETADDARRTRRVLRFLLEHGLTGVLAETVVLTMGTVVAGFPEQFCLFLDTLKPAEPENARRLPEVCERLGRSAILAKAGALVADGLLREDRVRKILAVPDRRSLPLVEVILQHDDKGHRQEVVAFLRKLALPGGEAGALWVDDPPRSYLLEVCRGGHAGEWPPRLAATAAALIQEFVGRESRSERLARRQGHAVYKLRELWSPSVEEFVRGLLKGKGLLRVQRAPRVIRDAARDVLHKMESDSYL